MKHYLVATFLFESLIWACLGQVKEVGGEKEAGIPKTKGDLVKLNQCIDNSCSITQGQAMQNRIVIILDLIV